MTIFLSLLSLGSLSIPLFLDRNLFHLHSCVGVTLVLYCTFVNISKFGSRVAWLNNKIFIYKFFREICFNCLRGQVD